jgi:outer membrane protein OmpA-like peptidoglycan-associated protein
MKKVLSSFAILLFVATVFGQYDPRENFYDAEFFFAEEDYTEALYSFKQVYDDGYQDNANINYRIGVCLLQIDGRKTEAIRYLQKAVTNINERYKFGNFKEEGAPPDAYLYLGNAHRINYDNEDACGNYQKYIEFFDEKDQDNHQLLYTRLQMDACKLSIASVKEPIEYEVGTLGQLNQISAPIFNAAISGNLETVAFMGRHKFYDGIYVSRKVDDIWMKPVSITPDTQSDGNQRVLSLSDDGNKILLAWSDEFDSEIWITEYANERWSQSKPIGRPINSKYFESHAALTPDGNTIYFTSNRKESIGEMDIFKSTKNAAGSWGELELLGETINTHLNEDIPYVSQDGKRLYFSSQGHTTLGGFDIYYVEINEDGTYGDPVNLGYPLNTSDDDYAISPKEIDYEGYLTIYAKGDADQVDLFRFELIPEFDTPVAVAFMEVEEVKPIFFDFDSYAFTKGATEKLDNLAMILKKFPNLEMEIKGHTDAVGTSAYNQLLSEKRAKAVYSYLLGKDIGKEQLKVKGFSESEPVAINRTADNKDAPKGRQLNRRVQFNVKIVDNVIIEIADIEVPDHLKIK